MKNLWLPYSTHKSAPPEVVSANGCTLTLADGREIIDGVSSWWTVCHGYNHPHLVQAVQAQTAKLHHVMLGGFVHEPALTLSKRLAKLTNLPHIFFSDSGSTSVEVALKMAAQYWKIKNKNTKKQRFLHFKNSYHGDTMGAMSVSDDDGMHSPFTGFMPMQFAVDIPTDELAFEEFDSLLKAHSSQLAAIIIEPLAQMAGGMKFHSPDVLAEIYRITKKHELLFIADEIATGFARTGYMFAVEEAGITPDIMCIGKALTGGILGMAATCASAAVFDAFSEHAFMHGPTYMANPIACAAANASLDLFEKEPRLKQVAHIEEILTTELQKCSKLSIVKGVRIKGAIGVVELNPTSSLSSSGLTRGSGQPQADSRVKPENDRIGELRQKFLAHGVNIRPFDDIIYLAPPFIISENELKTLTGTIIKVLSG